MVPVDSSAAAKQRKERAPLKIAVVFNGPIFPHFRFKPLRSLRSLTLGRSPWWPIPRDRQIFTRSSTVRACGSRSAMASHGSARSIPSMAEPGPAEREASRLREVQIDNLPLFGWHSRHWSWFLEILGRGRKLDQLSLGAWCRSPGFLPAGRRSLRFKSSDHDRAPEELDCSERGRRTELVRGANGCRYETKWRHRPHLLHQYRACRDNRRHVDLDGGGYRQQDWNVANERPGAHVDQVDNNEHPHGQMQIYQPDNGGIVFIGRGSIQTSAPASWEAPIAIV
jgi:hypothetical protein